jgi:hypothetical protein
MSRGSSVGIATAYGLHNRGIGVRVLVGPGMFTSPYRPTGSETHPASYPIASGGSFPGGKGTGAWS